MGPTSVSQSGMLKNTTEYLLACYYIILNFIILNFILFYYIMSCHIISFIFKDVVHTYQLFGLDS